MTRARLKGRQLCVFGYSYRWGLVTGRFAVVLSHEVIEDHGGESPDLNKLAIEFSKEGLSFLRYVWKLDSRDRLSAREPSFPAMKALPGTWFHTALHWVPVVHDTVGLGDLSKRPEVRFAVQKPNDEEWEIVMIVGKRRTRKDYEHEVRWKNIRLPRSEVVNAQSLLREFEAWGRAQCGRKRSRPARSDSCGWSTAASWMKDVYDSLIPLSWSVPQISNQPPWVFALPSLQSSTSTNPTFICSISLRLITASTTDGWGVQQPFSSFLVPN